MSDGLLLKRNPKWSVLYEQAYNDDGTLWFPERLSEEFLDERKRVQGSRIFANNYLNVVFSREDAIFKEEWFKYYDELPKTVLNTVAFFDPAISQEDGADYTGITVVSVDADLNWWVRHASRARLTPTELIEKLFEVHRMFGTSCIGIEDVAFQKLLLVMAHEEMKKRGMWLPITGVKHGPDKTKEMRISGALVPRMEWGFIHFPKSGMDDLKRELLQFPRAAHDDVVDSLASCAEIITYPNKPKETQDERNPHGQGYERSVIRNLVRKANASI